jgi:hypothetical protein
MKNKELQNLRNIKILEFLFLDIDCIRSAKHGNNIILYVNAING